MNRFLQPFIVICCLALLPTSTIAATTATTISGIQIMGLKRTKAFVVEQELLFGVGDTFNPDDLFESVRRLKNLRIFADVKASVLATVNGKHITINVIEKWTLIPIVKFGGDEGILSFTTGAYDVNFLGRYLEVGGQYEYLGGGHSGVVWYRDPRLAGSFWRLGTDLWGINRIRGIYDESGNQLGGYTQRRYRANVFADKEFRWWLKIGFGVDFNQDSFSQKFLGDPTVQLNTQNGIAAPPTDGRSIFVRNYGTFGRLNYDIELVDGITLDYDIQRAGLETGSDFSVLHTFFSLTGFKELPYRQNVGARLSLGHTTSQRAQHRFYLGALDYLRGYEDSQLTGDSMWQGNLEYRIASLATDWLVLQHAVFFDVAAAANGIDDLFGSTTPRFSTGGGLRLISPRIYRIAVRLDYAYAHNQANPHGISFGVQQFF